MTRGLADTSVFIARESGRPIDEGALPDEVAVSVVTIGELRVGVLVAADVESRDRRLVTLTAAQALEPIPIDEDVVTAWSRLRVLLRDAGRRMPLNDSWIAATAMAHGVALVTQDVDQSPIGDLTVIHV